ncbi:MAG: hypothetical protein Q8907_11645 [Bacteroidota bacterium]|nr:hypothetical protein [Bacteroidota bacterium]
MQGVKICGVVGKEVDVSGLAPGSYLLRIKIGNDLITKFFVKSK